MFFPNPKSNKNKNGNYNKKKPGNEKVIPSLLGFLEPQNGFQVLPRGGTGLYLVLTGIDDARNGFHWVV